MLQATYPEFGERTFDAGRFPYSLVILEVLFGAIKTPTVEVTSLQVGEKLPTQIHQGYLHNKPQETKSEYSELDPPHEGWKSGVYSNTLGKLPEPEQLTLTYTEPVEATNFAWWCGDVYKIRDFEVVWLLQGNLVRSEKVTNNEDSLWKIRTEPMRFDQMILKVTRVVPRGANVQINFFGPVHRIVFTPDGMRDYRIIEDLILPGESPLGVVNANSFDLALDNGQGWLTPGAQKSPFLDLFYPRMLIHPLGGFQMDDNVYELVSLGKFYTADWGGSRLSLETTIYSLDRLGNFLNQKMPPIPLYRDMKPEEFLKVLFYTLGLVEDVDFYIDPRISNTPRLCWTEAATYGEAFQRISEAGNFYITCNRNGVICAIANKGVESAEQVFTDDDLLMESTVPHLYKKVFNSVDMEVYANQKGEKTEVWRSSATIPPTGTYSPTEVTFSIAISTVAEVLIDGVPGVGCSYIRSGAASAIFTLTNTTNEEKVIDVALLGTSISNSSETVRIGETTPDEAMLLVINNKLIQDKAEANNLGQKLLTFLTDSQRETSNSWRVDLRTELGDVVTINNVSHGVVQEKVVVKGMQIDYNGGFKGTLITQKELSS